MRDYRPGWLRRSVNSLIAFLVCAVLLYSAIFRDHTVVLELWRSQPVQEVVQPVRAFLADRSHELATWSEPPPLTGPSGPDLPFPFPQSRPLPDLGSSDPERIGAILRAGYPDSLCRRPFASALAQRQAQTGEIPIAVIRARAPGYPDRHILRNPETGSWVMLDHFAASDEACQADFGAAMDLLP